MLRNVMGDKDRQARDQHDAHSDAHRTRARGFTLLEVMLGLALLGLGLTVLIKSAAGSIFSAQQAHMMGVVTDLARRQDVRHRGDSCQGRVLRHRAARGQQGVRRGRLARGPLLVQGRRGSSCRLEQLQALSQAHAAGSAGSAGSGSAGSGGFGGSDKGPLDSEGDFEQRARRHALAVRRVRRQQRRRGRRQRQHRRRERGAFVQAQYTMFQQILKVSSPQGLVTVTWQVMGSDRDMKVVAFFTDAAAMDKVITAWL